MRSKITTVRVDDIDGSDASTTWSLRVDGRDYELDLSATNTAKLTELLAPYLAAGKKLPGIRQSERKHNYVTQIPEGAPITD